MGVLLGVGEGVFEGKYVEEVLLQFEVDVSDLDLG